MNAYTPQGQSSCWSPLQMPLVHVTEMISSRFGPEFPPIYAYVCV